MKLFIIFLKSKLKTVLIFAIFAAVFGATFFLYGIPIKAVIYPLILSLFIGSVFILVEFISVKRRHQMLENAKKLTSEAMGTLTAGDNITENDLNEIIELLKRETARITAENDLKFREMTEYYTVWAHQIKTPIASMKLTLEKEDSPVSRRLSSELFRIEQYVSMVLVYIRLGDGASDFVFKEYELDRIIKNNLKNLAHEFIDRHIFLDFKPTEKMILTDEKWLGFVIGQIISNALKYTPEGRISIYTDGDILCISDTGIGIDPADIPRIFEKGYTGSNGRLNAESSGVGLYLCRKICEKLGASVTADSVIGEGTTVKIDLSHGKFAVE